MIRMTSEPESMAQHKAIKKLLKQVVQHNPNLTPIQKQITIENIDRAAEQADWVMDMMKMCGYRLMLKIM